MHICCTLYIICTWSVGGPGPVSSIQGTPLPPLPPDRPTPPPAAGQSDSLGKQGLLRYRQL